MTRAPKDTARPTRRLVQANGEPLMVEFTERTVTFRPPRSRKVLARTTWGVLLLRVLKQ